MIVKVKKIIYEIKKAEKLFFQPLNYISLNLNI